MMDKIIENMTSGYIKILNLGNLRNIPLEQENLIVSMAKTCKIDKLIIMDEIELYVKEILQNEKIKEVCLYGQDYNNFEILRYVKQAIVNDMSKRFYNAPEFLYLIRNNKNLRRIKCSFDIHNDQEQYQQLMVELLLNYKIEKIQNARERYSKNDDIQLIVDRNNSIWNDSKKKALNFIAIRKFRCNYENINTLQGNSIFLAQLPKEIILEISKHIFTLTRQDIAHRKSQLQMKVNSSYIIPF